METLMNILAWILVGPPDMYEDVYVINIWDIEV